MATEYIKREDALNAIRKSPISNMGTRLFCVDAIADIPAADVVERKHGGWVQVMGKYDWMYVCSKCGFVPIEVDRAKYCPNCGAEMECADDV